MKTRTVISTALAAGTAYLAFERLRRPSWIDPRGKIVLITGGSRGLGLAMAREFGASGAIIAICARDQQELDRATADLSARGVQAHTFVCDITHREEVQTLVAQVTERLGPIDIMVNNAGIIRVGPVIEMDIEDFEQAMDVMFWGPLYVTKAVLPAMLQRRQGSIVNITSIGGKVSVPHLLPYSCAKFALVALSEGLRAELSRCGIRVTTIAPGLMRTGSHLKAEFKGSHADEYAWFAAGATTPLVSIGVERAARSIVRATLRGDSEKILSVPADLLARVHGLLPGLTSELLGFINRLLPGAGGTSGGTRVGEEIESGFNSRMWKIVTKLGQKAAETMNETPGLFPKRV